MRTAPRLGLVAGLWGAWTLLHLLRTGDAHSFAPLQRWMEFAGHWQQADLRMPTLPEFGAAVAGHLAALGAAVLFAVACAGTGRSVSGWIGRSRSASPGALRLLLGFGLLGGWQLGLALSGLWFPAVMLVLPAAMAAAEFGIRIRRSRRGRGDAIRNRSGRTGVALVWSASAAFRSTPGPALLAIGAVIPALAAALLPDISGDPDKGHLAAVSQWLIAHRLDGFAPTVALHYPMTVEMNTAWALVVGRTEWAHLIQLVPFLAAVGMIAVWAARTGGPAAGWLAGAGILALGTVGEQSGTAKSDLGAAAFLSAGAVMGVRWAQGGAGGLLALSGALFGFGAACKFNGCVVAAAALPMVALLRRGPRRPGWGLAAWVLAATVPVLPWLAKTFLLAGDPLWPALSAWLPGARWDDTDQRALALLTGSAEMTAGRWAGLASFFARGLAEAQPAAALAIPVVAGAVASASLPVRWLAGFGLVAFSAVAIAAPFEVLRLALPAWMIWIAAGSVLVARAAGGWHPARARLAVWTAAVLTWVPVGASLMSYPEPGLAVSCLVGARDRDAFHAEALTTYDEVRRAVTVLPGARRIILLGEGRLGRYPCRVVTDRFPGRNFGWDAAGDSATPGRIAVKMRQLGCRRLVYNFVWETFPHPVETAWSWEDRRLEVWREFVGRYLQVARWPVRPDDQNGGFAILALRDRALAIAPDRIPYLPGLQSLTFPFMQAGLTGRAPEGAELALAAVHRVPGVHALAELAGMYCDLQERWADVERVLRPGVVDGFPGRQNFRLWARSMERMGRGPEAVHRLTGILAGENENTVRLIREALLELSVATPGSRASGRR